ncbi:hypothetical protein Tco_1401436 [Tanacetum coccineum]
MASIFGSKSKYFMTMSIPPQDEPLINQTVNDPRDFAKLVNEISLPQDVLSTSDRHLIELENQVQRLMEAYLTPKQSVQVDKISSSCEICSGPHDTQYCMENPKQAFVDYASSRTDEAGGRTITICPKKPDRSRNNNPGGEEQEEKDNPKSIHTNPSSPPDPSIAFVTEKGDDSDIMFIEIIKKYDDSCEEGPGVDVNAETGELNPREDPNRRVRNFRGRVKGMHIFVGNFTYVSDFMIVEDISSIIHPRLSRVVLGKPFIEVSNMTHDLSSGVLRFTNGAEEIAYKMPHKIEQYNSLSDLEKEHTKSVYFRNEEDKRT